MILMITSRSFMRLDSHLFSASLIVILTMFNGCNSNERDKTSPNANYKPSGFNFFGVKIGTKKADMPYPSLQCKESTCKFNAYEYKPITDRFGTELVRVITVHYDDNNVAYKIDAFSSICPDPKERDKYLNTYNGLKINDPYLKFDVHIGQYSGIDNVQFSVTDTKLESDFNQRIALKSSQVAEDIKNFDKK